MQNVWLGLSVKQECLQTMGERFQMSAAVPAGCLPGSRLLVIVPGQDSARAKALVASLPVSRNEGAKRRRQRH